MYEKIYTPTSRAIKMIRRRVITIACFFLLLFSVIICRLFQVMILQHSESNNFSELYLQTRTTRADIIDRNGAIIATSLPTVSLYANIREIMNADEAAEKISKIFPEIGKKHLKKKLQMAKKFLWIKRNLSPMQEQAVLYQGIPGFHFLNTEKRVYPDKNLLAHVVGGTDIDNNGIAGIEKVFDSSLSESGKPLVLSLDVKIQHAVHDELSKSIEEFRAIGGAAVIMEIASGEILSMVSLPDFDPNKNSDPNDKARFNMITSAAIEPGSSAKLFNTAMALEHGISPFALFDARFPLKIGRFTIHDFQGKARIMTVEEILKYSSNIGSAKIALKVGTTGQKKFFKKIGLLDTVSCELLETQRPLYPKQWGEANTITISFGHGIALSPLHLITTVAGILNDGILNNPTLLKRNMVIPGRRIVSSKTSKRMCALMRINVTEGANRFAEVKGYFVGGKSGTAEKQKNGRYLKTANYTGFIGAFPMTNPKYAVYVVLDEPQATAKTHGYRTAGWIAAPTAANIIRRVAPMLNVMASSAPEPNWKEKLKAIK